MDPYASCPCGSGKKFKWCCQPIHVQITKAFQLDAEGQYDTALRLMDQIAAEHPGNPEVWGRKAQLLYQMDKVDEAENALEKAFEVNPNYPFGHYLRGKFRHYEGEIAGALMMFRKATALYDPEARNILSQIHALIADCELRLNRPVAARAALQMAQRFDPTMEEFRKSQEQLFGEGSHFPLAARREYKYQAPAASAGPERRAAWDKALAAAGTGKLADAAGAFDKLVKENEADAAAWYNLGLTRAWQGDGAGAIAALDRYVGLETDESQAADAWALAEVLRCGQGLEDQADYVTHSAVAQLRDPQAFVNLLEEFSRDRRLGQVDFQREEGVMTGLILEKVQALTPEAAGRATPRPGAFFLIAQNILRLWNVSQAALDRVIHELRERIPGAIAELQTMRGPVQFPEVVFEGFAFPLGAADDAEIKTRMSEAFAHFVEDTWIHRPLHALNQVPPVDAAGHGTLRKKLLGAVLFIEQCAKLAGIPYDFERLRRKLGLVAGAAPAAGGAAVDIAALGVAELAQLDPETLSDDQAELAYQSAVKLDARDLAGRFAKSLIARPPRPDRPDRYPWFGQLIQLALAEGNTAAALDYLAQGEKHDSEQNEGRRRSDYDLRRGQLLHARHGDVDLAQDIFECLIARVPSELRFRSSAAEAMLSAKQRERAARFAQEGLAQARKQNDRDSEEHFKELLAAAQK